MNPHDITLTDHEGVTWVRHHCRCCGRVLWSVLGDPIGLCGPCDVRPSDPLGLARTENKGVLRSLIHVKQYHGELTRSDV